MYCSQGSVEQLIEQWISNPKLGVRIPPEVQKFSWSLSVSVIITDVAYSG